MGFNYLQCWKDGKKNGGKISIENKCRNAQHEAQCMRFVCSLLGPFPLVRGTLMQQTCCFYLHALQSRRACVVRKLLLSTSAKCIFLLYLLENCRWVFGLAASIPLFMLRFKFNLKTDEKVTSMKTLKTLKSNGRWAMQTIPMGNFSPTIFYQSENQPAAIPVDCRVPYSRKFWILNLKFFDEANFHAVETMRRTQPL